MMENRISGLKCDTDVFVTFEGDNVVMLQVRFRKCLSFLNSIIFKIKNFPKIWSVSCGLSSLIGRCFPVRHWIFEQGFSYFSPHWFLTLNSIFSGLRKLHVHIESESSTGKAIPRECVRPRRQAGRDMKSWFAKGRRLISLTSKQRNAHEASAVLLSFLCQVDLCLRACWSPKFGENERGLLYVAIGPCGVLFLGLYLG